MAAGHYSLHPAGIRPDPRLQAPRPGTWIQDLRVFMAKYWEGKSGIWSPRSHCLGWALGTEYAHLDPSGQHSPGGSSCPSRTFCRWHWALSNIYFSSAIIILRKWVPMPGSMESSWPFVTLKILKRKWRLGSFWTGRPSWRMESDCFTPQQKLEGKGKAYSYWKTLYSFPNL